MDVGALHRAAIGYATRYGLAVFPLSPGGKQPLYRSPHPKKQKKDRTPPCRGRSDGCELDGHGVLDATTDPETIDRWWGRTPRANIAIATGNTGVDVIDFDIKQREDGTCQNGRLAHRLLTGTDYGLEDLLARYHLAARTASGGLHLYYPADPDRHQGNGANPTWGVDFRGTGGYVVAPPSRTGTGTYRALPSTDLHRAIDQLEIYGRAYQPFDNAPPCAHWWSGTPGHYQTPAPVRWEKITQRLRGWHPAAGIARRRETPRHRPVHPHRGKTIKTGSGRLDGMVDWLSKQATGNRNNALYWAARVATDNGATPNEYDRIATAAIGLGLDTNEVWRTIDSARNNTPGGAQ